MTQQGYYSNRIKELEKRKEEVTAQLVTSKLTLKGINKEIENCFEYMNSAHYNKDNTPQLQKEIEDLEHRLNVRENTLKKMNNTINQKNGKIKSLNKVIEDKDHEISVLKLKLHNKDAKFQERIAELNIELNKKLGVN